MLVAGVLILIVIVIGFCGMMFDDQKIDRLNNLDVDLVNAIVSDDKERVFRAIEHGAKVNGRLSNGVTPLVCAIENKSSIEIFRSILNAGAWVDVGDKSDTLLMVAIKNKTNPDVIKLFLQCGSDPNQVGGGGSSALIEAVRHDSDEDIVWDLIQAGADVNHSENCNGHTPLTIAAHCCSSGAVIRMLTQAGANVNARIDIGRSPLMFASRSKVKSSSANLEVFNALVQSGADVHARDENANTVLMMLAGRWASYSAEMISSMREAVVSANAGKNIWPYKLGDIQERLSDLKSIPLMVESLIEVDAEMDSRNKDGDTALMLAVRGSRYADFAEILIQAGANIDEQNKEGQTALMSAVIGGYRLGVHSETDSEVVKFLLDSGADTEVEDATGKTALGYAKDQARFLELIQEANSSQ